MVHSAFLFLISSRIVFFLPQIAYPLVFVCCFEEVLRVTAECLLLLSFSLFGVMNRRWNQMQNCHQIVVFKSCRVVMVR